MGRRVKLARKGRVFWGLCPFHKEKSPSFKVENERRNYHCFGCGAGGSAFKWLQETEGLSFPEAVQRLPPKPASSFPPGRRKTRRARAKRKSLYEIIELGLPSSSRISSTRAPARPRGAICNRAGSKQDAQKRYRLGYAPDSNGALIQHLRATGHRARRHGRGRSRRAPPKTTDRPRDFFYDRVMFPIADPRGRIVAFGGRGLAEDAKPKYINTGETTLFSKGRLLYNFAHAREAALKGPPLIVAEGYMDVIALAEAGFTTARRAPWAPRSPRTSWPCCGGCRPSRSSPLTATRPGAAPPSARAGSRFPISSPGQSLRFVFLPGRRRSGFPPEAPGGRSHAARCSPRPSRSPKPCGIPRPRTAISPRPSAAPGSKPPSRPWSSRSGTGRSPSITGGTSPTVSIRRSSSASARTRAPAGTSASSAADFRGDRSGYGRRQREGAQTGFVQDPVSAAVKHSLHAVNSLSAAKSLTERRLIGLLISAPHLVERYSEALAWLTLDDPQLDKIRKELLNLAASAASLDKTSIEGHFVREGIGALAERLRTQSVLQSDLKGQPDDEAREALLLRTRAQLADPDSSGVDELLKARRDQALQRYLDGGSNADWEELQRLQAEIRKAADPEAENGN